MEQSNIEPTRLYLMRHGEVEGHGKGQYLGHTDVALTKKGLAQSVSLAIKFKDIELTQVYASDLKRARTAGEMIARNKGLELKLMPEFREADFGRWEGLNFEEILKRYPEEVENSARDFVNYRITSGESLKDLEKRVMESLKRIISANPGGQIALAAHSGVNRIIILKALGSSVNSLFSLKQDYGCLNIIDFYPDGNAVVLLVNQPNEKI